LFFLLKLAVGDCVEDIKVLEGDDGFCEVSKKPTRQFAAISILCCLHDDNQDPQTHWSA